MPADSVAREMRQSGASRQLWRLLVSRFAYQLLLARRRDRPMITVLKLNTTKRVGVDG